jgi:hypothetical protein
MDEIERIVQTEIRRVAYQNWRNVVTKFLFYEIAIKF